MESPTIEMALRRLFPAGTRAKNVPTQARDEKRPEPDFLKAPQFPTDVFAAAAWLIESADVYRRIAPAGPRRTGQAEMFPIGAREIEDWRSLGKDWRAGRSLDDCVRAIDDAWAALLGARGEPVHGERVSGAPAWWRAALRLLIIADEACAGLGFALDEGGWFDKFLLDGLLKGKDVTTPVRDDDRHSRYAHRIDTLTVMVDPYVARVLPKSRTPQLGCTMRTLSQHLALMPRRGAIDLQWTLPPAGMREDGEALNILAVPYPFEIPAASFRPVEDAGRDASSATHDWGWFDIAQTWLDDEEEEGVAALVLSLVAEAEKDVGRVHAVVLPEFALDLDSYCSLVRILRDETEVEFLVAGSSQNLTGERGNFVLTATFHDREGARCAVSHARAKHHRWRLDGRQIREYGLASALDPHRLWWENAMLPSREVGQTVFRKGSVFSAMVCEDLARSEPCHAALRSLGPNLVFVLLMDGPQVAQRWPARYATTLADDPGSSVLTLTSLGLIERANAMARREASRAIALWKDDVSGVTSLSLPAGAQGLVVTLSGEMTVEATLDGRRSESAHAWRYHGHQPVRLSGNR